MTFFFCKSFLVFKRTTWGKIEESEKIDKYLDLAWERKKTVEYENDGDTNCG